MNLNFSMIPPPGDCIMSKHMFDNNIDTFIPGRSHLVYFFDNLNIPEFQYLRSRYMLR